MEHTHSINGELLLNENFKLVLFGETHGYLNDLEMIREIVSKFKPSVFIWEMFENKSCIDKKDFNEFLKNKDENDFSLISTYGELKGVVSFIDSHNIPLVGCDLPNMGRKDKIDFNRKLNLSEEKQEGGLLKTREQQQAKVIIDHLNKGRRVIASVGAYHLRPGSNLLKCLAKINYIIVQPKRGNTFIYGPEEGLDKEGISFFVGKNI